MRASSDYLHATAPADLTNRHPGVGCDENSLLNGSQSVMSEINWEAEQRRFMEVAYQRTLRAARRAFWHWRENKREEAIQTCLAQMWLQWVRILKAGKQPESMLGCLIKYACLHVRYDRPVSIMERARTPDVFDYRSGFKRQQMSEQGEAAPSDRSDAANPWINWNVQAGDNPCDLASALEETGISLAQWCDL